VRLAVQTFNRFLGRDAAEAEIRSSTEFAKHKSSSNDIRCRARALINVQDRDVPGDSLARMTQH